MRKMAVLAVLAMAPAHAQIQFKDILRGPSENWLTYAGDYASQRHSPLKQINRANVNRLVPKWIYHVPGARKLETVPLVHENIMYATNTNEVYALDARNGRRLWHYRAEGVTSQRTNRGVALLGDRVFFVTTDAHLVALHKTTGNLLWDREFASAKKGYASTIAPLAVKDKILVGVTGGGSGQRGFVAALSAETGDEMWRFWTVPAKGEPGAETWSDFPTEWAGAPTWTTGSYDPELNLIYWPTGNPWPDFYGGDRKGDNLYSDSVVALDADTGKMKWYFQFTPHDTHDWDANETLVLLDAEFRGRMRKLMIQANRNGFYYILDRTNGEFLMAKPFVKKLNWATGVNDKGRPMEVPNMEPTPGGRRVCPSVRGASNWMSPSYNPDTRLLYVVTLEQCDIYTSSSKDPVPSSGFRGTGGEQIPAEPGEFSLRALNAVDGELRWEHPMPGPATMWAGTVSTAGGLVFSGDDDGNLVALDAETGKDLWHFATGHSLYASPMTFSAGGKQYVTIATETDIFTFGLFEEEQ
ncbi:MAG: PQQ-dependent dehydrogenase, methanol/ethanol family [Bryobacteraceae bacterium]